MYYECLTMLSTRNYISLFDADYKLIINYEGVLTYDKMNEVLRNIKSLKFKNKDLFRRVYTVASELLDNVYRHSKPDSYSSSFALYVSQENYRVLTINPVAKVKSNAINDVQLINSLPEDSLKNHFMNKINSSEINERGTIGLGFDLIRLKSKGLLLLSSMQKGEDEFLIVDVKVKF